MHRREFISRTSSGLVFTLLAPGIWRCSHVPSNRRYFKFRPYRPGRTAGEVTIVTPEDGFYMHTYYDICPWSPSGRYLAVTELPYQDHDPVFGETAKVCVVDLKEESIRVVYTTKAWGFQLGANINWGKSDRYVYTNDIIDGEGVCIRVDLETGEVLAYSGYKTHLSPDETHFLGASSDLMNSSQRGYAFPDIPGRISSIPAPGVILEDEGIWRTDLETGDRDLLASIADFHQKVPNPEEFRDRSMMLFFSKYNRQGTRCLEFLRAVKAEPREGERKFIQMAFSHRPDGSDIVQAVTHGVHSPKTDWEGWRPDWKPGGHHITWTPDGKYCTMNLKPDGMSTRFCHFKYDGSEFRVLSETIEGSGHPSLEKTGRFLVADAYPVESIALPNKEVPIRLIDLEEDREILVCHVFTRGIMGPTRCDPHPCWSRDYSQFCFNGAPEDRRQVFIADLPDLQIPQPQQVKPMA